MRDAPSFRFVTPASSSREVTSANRPPSNAEIRKLTHATWDVVASVVRNCWLALATS